MTALQFKIVVPHSTKTGWHQWWFPNGWQGVGPIERRDRGGRQAGRRAGHFPEWFVLGCNNPQCQARAIVPVSFLTDFADSQDEAVTK